ncbi:MAG: M4 family metallopeptidase [Sphingobacteriales bacterium]|nr:M4 family metallopeptidase [Sphingobacteriales bacterium]
MAAFVTVANLSIEGGNFEFDLLQNGITPSPLPPGNYAILIRNPYNGTITGLNLRLEYPNCEVERKLLQTAYWGIERTHQFFKGIDDPINEGMSINLTLPTGIVQPAPMTDDGHSQFSHHTNPIGIGIVNDALNNALFVPGSIGAGANLFKISRGNPDQPMVALDVLAHEYGHAINAMGMSVAVNSNPAISPEADAINEGFSDIIGAIVEATSRPPNENWVMGDATPIPTRNMSNPNSQDLPSIYNGNFWQPTIEQELLYGLQYIRSLVFSHWFYLLSPWRFQTVNGVTYTVPALDIETAGKITLAAFVSNQFGLDEVANKNYMGLCRATTRAANALFPPVGGTCSPEVLAVRDAWRAVGLDCWGTITPALCAAACPDLPDPSITTVPTCSGVNLGQIRINNYIDVSNYYIQYFDAVGNQVGNTIAVLSGLAAGDYYVTIADPDAGCSETFSVHVGTAVSTDQMATAEPHCHLGISDWILPKSTAHRYIIIMRLM